MKKAHKYIIQSENSIKGMISIAGFIIVDYYLNEKKMSRNKWKKNKELYVIAWTRPNGDKQKSKKINYREITSLLREKGNFNSSYLDLQPMQSFWMDQNIDLKLHNHISDHTGALGLLDGTPQQQYGADYPIKPKLEREGHLYTTFQPQLLNRIINQRVKLIENSHLAIEDEWVFDLRSLINDTISLLDITLNQFYIKAEYSPLPEWKINKSEIEKRYGQRLNDKLNRIYKITGKNLNIESERKSLDELREIRNHLMHFDPPSLIITIEEATEWLNQIIDIGIILIKIRKAINAEISDGLVSFILQKEAIFNPIPSTRKRKPINKSGKTDYKSSTW